MKFSVAVVIVTVLLSVFPIVSSEGDTNGFLLGPSLGQKSDVPAYCAATDRSTEVTKYGVPGTTVVTQHECTGQKVQFLPLGLIVNGIIAVVAATVFKRIHTRMGKEK